MIVKVVCNNKEGYMAFLMTFKSMMSVAGGDSAIGLFMNIQDLIILIVLKDDQEDLAEAIKNLITDINKDCRAIELGARINLAEVTKKEEELVARGILEVEAEESGKLELN